jgi:DNA invertase Pin-like site-specific DNA recombinase
VWKLDRLGRSVKGLVDLVNDQMTDAKIQAARKLLESRTPPREVAHSLGVSIPTLYRWVPALHGPKGLVRQQA